MLSLLVFGTLFLLLDQSSKRLAWSGKLSIHRSAGRPFQIRCVANRNRLYSHAATRAALVATWLFATASVVALRSTGMWFQSLPAMAGLGCALGGAAGNLLDIVRRQCVIDFIDFGWWPVFNFADIGIVGGLVLAFWH